MTDAAATEPVLLIAKEDGIATLTLNRPKNRNALSSGLLREIRKGMAQVDADPEVAVIVLTGADPAFSAGLDLKELGSQDGQIGRGLDGEEDGAPSAVGKPWGLLTKPLIGAVNGVAVTGGFELALNCDFLIASERAAFGDTHVRVGILPGWGLSVLLPQAIGFRRAKEMSLTGNFVGAEEALRLGLVNHVVPHEELLPFTYDIARTIAQNDQAAGRELLASYDRIAAADGIGEGIRLELETSRAWARRSSDPDEVARRRDAIMARGRTMKA